MRVTFNAMYDNSINATNQHYAALSDAMTHTQYRVLKAGDDPLSQGNIVALNAAIAEIEIYERESNEIESLLRQSEVYIDAYYDRLLDLDETLIELSNGTVAEDDYELYSKELKAIEEDLASALNAQDTNGNYIFGGTVTDEPPFQKETVSMDVNGDGTPENIDMYVYKGNDQRVLSKTGSTSEIPTTINGSELVNDGNGGNVFQTIGIATYYLDQGQAIPDDTMSKLQQSVSGTMDSVVKVKTDLGINIQEAQSNTMLYSSMKQEYTTMLSNEQDADIVEAVINIQKEQQMIQVISETTKMMMETASISFLD
ncbi:hypothetical protein [Vibrio crassostreae]|uniref:flagellin N-terminal helical domain-containing protein n=1 Tax=Vibrio crassostreae TaxID=246167 RepID=UPI001B301430|nr:hypothetical protein [Vibrio crassostreae]